MTTVYSWGKGSFGQLGVGSLETTSDSTQVAFLDHTAISSVACGLDHSAVVSSTYCMYCIYCTVLYDKYQFIYN